MSRLHKLLRAREGAMTSEMVLHPTAFGLGRVPQRLKPAATTTAVCGYCSTGCGLKIHLNEHGEAINLTADPDYPVNAGMACPKGWEALTPLAATDRATTPLLRNPVTGRQDRVSWPEAIDVFTRRLRAIQEKHGRDAIAFLSTGQIVVEEMALLGALFKFGMGARHCDSNTRQCMATTHVAYKESFGFDAPPYTYRDFEESDALIFIGANPCIAHPIMWQRVMRNRRNPEIVVVDPRLTETAQAATLHVPLKPKSDLTLLYGLANLLIECGTVAHAFVEAHTRGFEEFAAFVRPFTLERVLTETGLTETVLRRLVTTIATRERVSFWWTMGVNQSHEATRTAQAIINLALMTGNIGRPGTGANSITGQCNAMGSRLFGNASSLLGGYSFGAAADRAHVAGILGIDPARIPAAPGYAYDQILDAIERGEIRGLWIIATNTAHSWINQSRARDLLRRLDFLVVQDMYATTETAQLADLVLPAAGWGEKDGVVINSERRLGLVKKVSRAPGRALSDFAIFKLVAEAWGCGAMFQAWRSPEAVFQILKDLSRGQPCDFSGIRDYAHLDAAGGIQWPFAAADAAAELRSAECGLRNEQTGEANAQEFSILDSRFSISEAGAAAELRSDGKLPSADCGAEMRNAERETRNEQAGEFSILDSRFSISKPAAEPGASGKSAAPEPIRTPHSAVRTPATLRTPTTVRTPHSALRNAWRERRLFEDGRFFTADGRARFVFDLPRALPEPPDAEYPFVLLTGRGTSAQWHTGSRTNKSAVLRKLAPNVLTAELNPMDARRLRIAMGDRVVVRSRRGRVEAVDVVTSTIAAGQVFLPMHFDGVNTLTFPAFDPHSRQPSYKSCAVAVERAGGTARPSD